MQGLVVVVGMNGFREAALVDEWKATRSSNAFAIVDALEEVVLGCAFERIDAKRGVWFTDCLARAPSVEALLVEEVRDRTTAELVVERARTCLVVTSVRGLNVESGRERFADLGLTQNALDEVGARFRSTEEH